MENNAELVTIYVMGKKHRVLGDLTIMKAMEYAGHQFTRGAGCRGVHTKFTTRFSLIISIFLHLIGV
jgi:hypothetical protein